MSIQRLGVVPLLCFLWAGSGQAQSRGAVASDTGTRAVAPDSAKTDASAANRRHFWQKIAGTSAPDALYLGWATWHLRYPMQPWMNNHFWGATFRGFHAGTFITSHDDRGYAVGVQRVLIDWGGHDVSAELGYRAGLVYGYDEEFLDIAERLPVLPALTGMLDLRWKTLGMQIGYAGIVMTVGGVVRF